MKEYYAKPESEIAEFSALEVLTESAPYNEDDFGDELDEE